MRGGGISPLLFYPLEPPSLSALRLFSNEDWKAVVQKYLTKRKLTKEMVDAFVDRVEVHEDANIVVHLIYDDKKIYSRYLPTSR